MPSAFLSNPAARPSTPGKVSPIASTGGLSCRSTSLRLAAFAAPGTLAAARRPANAMRCAVSASVRVNTWSNTHR